MTERSPTLASLLQDAIARQTRLMRVALPGRVERYDETKQLADVLPLIQERFEDENGTEQVESLPVIPNVPVVFPGSGGFRITFPVNRGDTVLLIFSDSSLDEFLAQGGEVTPEDPRRFSLNDAIAIPGLRDFANPLLDAPTDRMTIGNENGPQIHLTDTQINIGSNNFGELQAAVLGDALQSFLGTVKTFLDTHTHGGVTTGPGVSGPPPVPSPSVPNVSSSTVKVKP